MTKSEYENGLTGFEIAVIGMAGRFPGAGTAAQFWENLKRGVESIAYFTDRELEEAGVPAEALTDPRYIRAWGWMDDVENFDAAFFGYTPLEAETMDPQVRIFHECVLTALENAGYDPYSYSKTVGLYAGASASLNWQARVELSENRAVLGKFASKQLSDKDFLCTHIAHRLNLKGPAVTLDTACSTSLVAVHMACQGLIGGDCDMALAGGVSLPVLCRSGYFYEEGLMLSPDGHCRAFDAAAKGTGFGNASAVVVLKRLEDALADGDTIHALIKGSAVNNDGAAKAAYTAPSFKGQARVIRTALKMAAIHPETVGYVETHGTGTALGDPVEIEGLKTAFNTTKKHFCRLGSVKTNVGHLEMAAGVTGFIKTVLALKHRLIPPTLFFEKPNPRVDFENSPFIVNTRLTEWKREGHPLRAGVSSFGIGGTNAHAVLEEWPEDRSADAVRKHHLILLSAKTETALEAMTANLANHLKEKIDAMVPTGPVNSSFLADTAYTLQVGRAVYPHRRMLVCATAEEAAALLSSPAPAEVKTYWAREANRPVVFMFPGLGSQYVNMGRELVEEEPVFRQEIDRCFTLLESPAGDRTNNLKEILYPSSGANRPGSPETERIDNFEIAQSLVFIIEYALAKLLIAWGVKPYALIGYSFGEYTAACISGVLTLEDALKLVAARGRLIREVPAGAMLSVPLSRQDLVPLLDEELSLAIDNGPSCVVAGPGNAVSAFENRMKEKKLLCMRVPVSHALHSRMMAPVREKFEEIVRTVPLNKPNIPYISNVTGNWTTDEDAVDPRYWASHLSETVRFADGMKTLLNAFNPILVEVGPGRDLSALAVRHLEDRGENGDTGDHRFNGVLNLLRLPHQKQTDTSFLLNRVGMLWLYGQPIDWERFYSGEKRRRIPVPTYPFEGRRFWIDSDTSRVNVMMPAKKPGIDGWFYMPSWKRDKTFGNKAVGGKTRKMPVLPGTHWLVFTDNPAPLDLLTAQLKKAGKDVVEVIPGNEFSVVDACTYALHPADAAHYERLFADLQASGRLPDQILHLWNVTGDRDTAGREERELERARKVLETGFHSLISIAQTIGKQAPDKKIRITVVTDNMQEVAGEDRLCPEKAVVLGPVKIIPTEYLNIDCRSIDLVLPGSGGLNEERQVYQLLEELTGVSAEPVTALRGNHRWVQTVEPILLENPDQDPVPFRLKEEGVYLVTGGLGGIGLALARYLAASVRARLILTGRTAGDGAHSPLVKELEDAGAKVLVFGADVTDPERMQAVIHRAVEQFGPLDGVIHCAGAADGEMIQHRTPGTSGPVLEPKVTGTFVLERLFKNMNLDFFILCSSIASMVPRIGQVAYCAANSFLDAFAHYKNSFDSTGTFTASINWDRWRNTGIAVIAEKQHKDMTGSELTGGLTVLQGVETFRRILDGSLPQVIVSTRDLGPLIEQAYKLKASSLMKELEDMPVPKPGKQHRRPSLDVEYIAPRDRVEQTLADIWARLFGIDRVGTRDDFFDLGGDSLKALIVLPKIHKELHVEVPIAEFFKRPTIERLSQFIRLPGGKEKRAYRPIPPVEKKEFYPVSYIQKRLFVLNEMGGTGTAYNNFFGFTVEGDVDWDRFHRALRGIIRRHESFRTSFHIIDGNPVQVAHDSVDFDIETLAPADNTPPDPAALIHRFVRPFDLKKAPLLRAAVVPLPLPRNGHLVFFDMHHIISDGTSIILFMRDLVHLYGDRELPPLTVRYTDFSQWQNEGEGKREIEKQEAFWLRHIDDNLPLLDMPTDFPRPRVQGFEGERLRFHLEGPLKEGLSGLVRETGTTLYLVLLALCNVLLNRYTGQEDIVIGSPAAGRDRLELENVIGLFINALLMRNFPRPHLSFSGFLAEVKENALQVFENQAYPFGKLVERMDLKKYINRNPLYDFELIVQNMEVPDLQTRGLQFRPYVVESGTAQVDIALEVSVTDENILFNLTYCTALFKKKTMEQFVRHFKEAAAAVIRDPEVRLRDIRLSHDLIPAGTTILEKDEGIDFGF
jgi:acyl transferase domain-containing protein/acyl carrier protein